MRVALFLGHPAHFHMLKHAAAELKAHGHEVFFVIKKKDILETLCQDAGFAYYKIREGRGGSKIGLIKSVLGMEWHMLQFIRRNKIDILVGSTLSFAAAKIARIPVIAMGEDDADVVPKYAKMVYPFASCVLTPNCCDNGRWNDKSSKYPSYHELAYLHPNHFSPSREVVKGYGIDVEKPYFIMRFAQLNAHHDSGIKGINTEIAQRLIDTLSPHGRIYITSERPLEPQFEKYRIKINPLDMHHVMAFASLYIGDSQTMAAEAGVLGVPFVRYNDFVGRIGYLRELEDVYRLGYGVHASPLDERKTKTENDTLRDINKKEESSVTCSNQHDFASQSAQEQALGHLDNQTPVLDIDKSYQQDSSDKKTSLHDSQKNMQASGAEDLYRIVEELVKMDSAERKVMFQQRRQQMLADKIDCAKFLTWFIENYPESAAETRKADANFWKQFR